MYKPLSSVIPPPSSKRRNDIANESSIIPTFMAQKERDILTRIIGLRESSTLKNGHIAAEKSTEVNTQMLLSRKSSAPLRDVNPSFKCPLPSNEEIQQVARMTKITFEKLLSRGMDGNITSSSSDLKRTGMEQTLQYKTKDLLNSEHSNTIKVIEKHHDPLAPSTKKILKRIPMPEENPELVETTIAHENNAGSKKLTQEEKNLANIPSVVSSWENSKGFSISIDKRLHFNKNENIPKQMNTKFFDLTQALDQTNEQKKMEIKARNDKLIQEKEEEEKLVLIKNKIAESKYIQAQEGKEKYYGNRHNQSYGVKKHGHRDRELIRKERRGELEQDLRYRNNRYNRQTNSGLLDRDVQKVKNKDSSETSSEVQYDARFFTQAANASAKRNEEQMYDAPLFKQKDETLTSVFRGRSGNTKKRNADGQDYVEMKDTPVEFSEGQVESSNKSNRNGLNTFKKKKEK